MSTVTPILGLTKPALTDAADITVLNADWDLMDARKTFGDTSDTTKRLALQMSGAITSTTLTLAAVQTANRTLTFPDATDTLTGRTTTDTLTNKTLTAPVITGLTVGTTFLLTNAVGMTLANTWYTGVTLGSALASGGAYLLSACALFNTQTGTADGYTLELYDSTNGIVIWAGEMRGPAPASQNILVTSPFVTYSGYAGTPTIILRAQSSGAGNFISRNTLVAGTADKVTCVTALRIS